MAFRTAFLPLAAVACLSTLSAGAQAQSAGALIGRLGVTQISPDVSSGNLTAPSFPGTQADILSNTQPTGGLTWMWTDNISFDVPVAAGFTHDIVGAGAIQGTGKIGEVKALPITLLAQYRFFNADAPLRPYLGIGPTYAKFYKARSTLALTGLTGGSASNPTTLRMDSKFAVTVQAGASWAIAPKWSLDLTVLKTFLKSRATLSTGQTLDATVDPTTISVGVGYQF